mmetsp:Transcript_101950/g.287748  ORF Transcript_101950/g.287748 Transcript_101950/m.287748 type:complete len:212 (-) Transcript_101950:182-817(-)|eukprot:CAMPEP_0117459582 /NCGR_PEP_ID=MMETSP0784-20121206/1556_1 /TAXON_ID=39447 /ORGANISM="" /LENGTH=211 /DNA_ID=CAMNT_0005253207 /DNA_START=67 /DNA_END=702 /DNA_ORIENTATION=-
MATAGAQEVDYESVYQPTFVNVQGPKWEKLGYSLIGGSTVIMILQAAALGPAWVWERADDVTTVLFTFELFVRIFEKGYLFFTENERNWNFFDSLVVAISLFSMVLSAKTAQSQQAGKPGSGGGGGGAMKQMKVLRTLRLLRLLRLCRVFKGIEKVNNSVDTLLEGAAKIFVSIIVLCALLALIATMVVALFAGAKAWLREHTLPDMPKIE